jgi:hypothetical protein
MSAFSFSAPIVTPDDEHAEREALPEEERQRIRKEVYGVEDEMEETDTMVEKAVLLLQEALHDIPDVEKQTYLEALERAPLLVETESDPIRFLRCEKYVAGAAAHRLVSYWEVRKKIFGPDRAFLPMTQNGAMAEDMVYSEKGFTTMLPDDDHGRPVVCCDRIRSRLLFHSPACMPGSPPTGVLWRRRLAQRPRNACTNAGSGSQSTLFLAAPHLLLHRDSIFIRTSTEYSRRICY